MKRLLKQLLFPLVGLFLVLNFTFTVPAHSITTTPGGEPSDSSDSSPTTDTNPGGNVGLPTTPGGEPSDPSDSNPTTDTNPGGNVGLPTTPGGEPSDPSNDPGNASGPPTNPGGESPNNSSNTSDTDPTSVTNDCYDQVGAIAWFVCPTTGWLSNVIDSLYSVIENFLVIPTSMLEGTTSPIYLVWQYLKDVANILFVILLLVVIWSQLTGLGINNYGIKKILPRLIISIIILNLSYYICGLAIDISNILGKSIYSFIQGVELQVVGNGSLGNTYLSIPEIVTPLLAGGAATALGISIAGGIGAILPMLIGAILVCAVSILVGFFTISLRQAVVMALIMVSPIAFVLYLLPNTEQWFRKWSNLFVQMLTFYPMFSLLFSTAQLAGYTFIASSNGEAFWVILGIVVMIAPLVLSVSLMKMSGTVLGRINSRLENLGQRPVGALRRSVLDPISQQRRQHYIANANAPGASLRRYLDARQRRRAIDTDASIKTRTALADINATKMIMKDADGESYEAGISEKKGRMRSNRYIQNLKRSQNVNLEAQYVAADRKHILGNYGNYYGETAEDFALAQESADNAKEFFRTQLTAINDDRSDMKWLTDQYKDILKQTDSQGNRLSQEELEQSYRYQHYITSAAGGLGPTQTNTVLGQIYARSASNEMAIQKDAHSLLAANKSLPPNFRSMMAGYLVDTQGFAVDQNGKRLKNDDGTPLELNPGDALSSAQARAKLVPYSEFEGGKWVDGENGAYSVLTDQKGNFITRIYRNDRPTVKEVLAGSDMPINDQMNSLYAQLAGIDRGAFSAEGLPDVGLSDYSNNIGKNLDDAGYVKKYPGVSRFFTAAVRQGKIKNFGDFATYTLDAIGKSSTPGAILTEDPESAKLLGNIMNPKNFSQIYNHDFFMNYENILGEKLTGTEFETDADGNIVYDEHGEARFTEIPHDQATDQQFMNTILRKFVAPGATKLAGHLSHNNFRIIDNQTANTARALDDFTDGVLATYSDPSVRSQYPILPNLTDEIQFIHANNDYLRNHRQFAQRQQQGRTTNPHSYNGYSGNNNGNNDGNWNGSTIGGWNSNDGGGDDGNGGATPPAPTSPRPISPRPTPSSPSSSGSSTSLRNPTPVSPATISTTSASITNPPSSSVNISNSPVNISVSTPLPTPSSEILPDYSNPSTPPATSVAEIVHDSNPSAEVIHESSSATPAETIVQQSTTREPSSLAEALTSAPISAPTSTFISVPTSASPKTPRHLREPAQPGSVLHISHEHANQDNLDPASSSQPIIIPSSVSSNITVRASSDHPSVNHPAPTEQSDTSPLIIPAGSTPEPSTNPYDDFDFESYHANDIFEDEPLAESPISDPSLTPTGGEIIAEIERYKAEIDSAPVRPSDRQARSDYYDRIIAYLGSLADSGDAIPMIETHYRNYPDESFDDFYHFTWNTISIAVSNIGL